MKNRTAFDKRSIMLIVCYLISSATLTIIAPIMPYLMKEKGIPTYFNSVIFWWFYVSGLASSIYTSKYLSKNGCQYFAYGGILGLAWVHFIYSLSSKLNPTMFLIVVILNRLVEGWSLGLIQGMVYGVGSQELPPLEFDKYARTWSASAGMGYSLALLFGSFLFSIGGYFLPYIVLSGSLVALACVIFFTGLFPTVVGKLQRIRKRCIC